MDEYVEKFGEPIPFGLTMSDEELAKAIKGRIKAGKPFEQKYEY